MRRLQNFAKSNLHLTFVISPMYVVPVKSKVEISQNFVAFSEYMNFKKPNGFLLQFMKFLIYKFEH